MKAVKPKQPNLILINQAQVDNAREFLQDVQNGLVDIGAVIYRKIDGRLTFRSIGDEDGDYTIALLTRVIARLCQQDEWDDE